jgi:hypothetical protein
VTRKSGKQQFVVRAPALDVELRRLLATFGREALRAAAKSATAARPGPKTKRDWLLFLPYFEQDAADWLNRRTPRSNYSIAKEVAGRDGKPINPSDMSRLQRKLRKERPFWRALLAYRLSVTGRLLSDPRAPAGSYSLADSLRALEELSLFDPSITPGLELRRTCLAQYRKRFGEPKPGLTWDDLERRVGPGCALGGLLGVAAIRAILAADSASGD